MSKREIINEIARAKRELKRAEKAGNMLEVFRLEEDIDTLEMILAGK